MKYMAPPQVTQEMIKECMFGRLTLEAFKHDWIEYLAGVSMVLGAIFFIVLITYYKTLEMALERVDHFGRS